MIPTQVPEPFHRDGVDLRRKGRQRADLGLQALAGDSSYVLPARRLADNGLDAWAQVSRSKTPSASRD
jgi:hypothetical protein